MQLKLAAARVAACAGDGEESAELTVRMDWRQALK